MLTGCGWTPLILVQTPALVHHIRYTTHFASHPLIHAAADTCSLPATAAVNLRPPRYLLCHLLLLAAASAARSCSYPTCGPTTAASTAPTLRQGRTPTSTHALLAPRSPSPTAPGPGTCWWPTTLGWTTRGTRTAPPAPKCMTSYGRWTSRRRRWQVREWAAGVSQSWVCCSHPRTLARPCAAAVHAAHCAAPLTLW